MVKLVQDLKQESPRGLTSALCPLNWIPFADRDTDLAWLDNIHLEQMQV